MMVVDNQFDLGQEVYLKTDSDQLKRLVTGINISIGQMVYELSCGERTSNHYEFEISPEVNNVLKTT